MLRRWSNVFPGVKYKKDCNHHHHPHAKRINLKNIKDLQLNNANGQVFTYRRQHPMSIPWEGRVQQ